MPLSLLITHFIGDFLLQSNWMALNKSKNWRALCIHCFCYSLCFFWLGFTFIWITFITHLIVDSLTSRLTSKLWFIELAPRGNLHKSRWPFFANVSMTKRHWFFVMIGLDQLIHYMVLFKTYQYIMGV